MGSLFPFLLEYNPVKYTIKSKIFAKLSTSLNFNQPKEERTIGLSRGATPSRHQPDMISSSERYNTHPIQYQHHLPAPSPSHPNPFNFSRSHDRSRLKIFNRTYLPRLKNFDRGHLHDRSHKKSPQETGVSPTISVVCGSHDRDRGTRNRTTDRV